MSKPRQEYYRTQLNYMKLERKQIGKCIYDKNLLVENMKDYFIYVSRTITDVITSVRYTCKYNYNRCDYKGRSSLSFLKDRIRICFLFLD